MNNNQTFFKLTVPKFMEELENESKINIQKRLGVMSIEQEQVIVASKVDTDNFKINVIEYENQATNTIKDYIESWLGYLKEIPEENKNIGYTLRGKGKVEDGVMKSITIEEMCMIEEGDDNILYVQDDEGDIYKFFNPVPKGINTYSDNEVEIDENEPFTINFTGGDIGGRCIKQDERD